MTTLLVPPQPWYYQLRHMKTLKPATCARLNSGTTSYAATPYENTCVRLTSKKTLVLPATPYENSGTTLKTRYWTGLTASHYWYYRATPYENTTELSLVPLIIGTNRA